MKTRLRFAFSPILRFSFEERLARLDRLITEFSRLVQDYPDNPSYTESLAKLRRERAELTATIGK